MNKNYVISNEKFVNDTEKTIYQIQSENKETPYIEFCLTNENLYIYEAADTDNNDLHIIKKSQITAVSVDTQKQAKDISFYLLTAIIIMLVGVLIPLITKEYAYFSILAVGAIVLIVGFIIGKPKYKLVMSIYTPSPLNIEIKNISPDKLNKLQGEILKI